MKLSAVKPAIALFVFTAASALIVGFMFVLTEEPIAEQARIREERAIASLIPDFYQSEAVDLQNMLDTIASPVVHRMMSVYDEANNELGFLFFAASPGYSGAVNVLVGFRPDGNLIGIRVISHTETPGIGSVIVGTPFISQFEGLSAPVSRARNPQGQHEIAHVAGATISVEAVLRAVNEAWDIFAAVEGRPRTCRVR